MKTNRKQCGSRSISVNSRLRAVRRGCERALIWLCLFSSLMLFAVSARAVSLRVGTVRGFPGNTVEVPVLLRYGSNEVRDVVALQADVVFDASGVTGSAPRSGTLLARHTLASSAPAPGTRRLLVFSLEN